MKEPHFELPTKITISNQNLDSLRETVLKNRKIEVLDASSNYISSTRICVLLSNLVELNLAGNQVNTFSEIVGLSSLKNLQVLNLQGNPIQNCIYYRPILVYLLPNLVSLDNHKVTNSQKNEANNTCRRNFASLPSLLKNMLNVVMCLNLCKRLKMHQELRRIHPLFARNIERFRPELFFREMADGGDILKKLLEVPFTEDLLDDVDILLDCFDAEDPFRYDKAFMDLMQKQLRKLEQLKELISDLTSERNDYLINKEHIDNVSPSSSLPMPNVGGPVTKEAQPPRVSRGTVSTLRNSRLQAPLDSIRETSPLKQGVRNRSLGKRSQRGTLRNKNIADRASSAPKGGYNEYSIPQAEAEMKEVTSLYLDKEREYTQINKTLKIMRNSLTKKTHSLEKGQDLFDEVEHIKARKAEISDRIAGFSQSLQENREKEYLADEINREIGQLSKQKTELKGQLLEEIKYRTDCESADQLREYHLKMLMFRGIQNFILEKKLVTKIRKRLERTRLKNLVIAWRSNAYLSQKMKVIKSQMKTRMADCGLSPLPELETVDNVLTEFRRRHFSRLMFICFQKMKENRQSSRDLAQLYEMAFEHREVRLIRTLFSTLKSHVARYKVEDQQIDFLYYQKERGIKRMQKSRVFRNWKSLHQNVLRFELQKKKVADAQYGRQLLKRCLHFFKRAVRFGEEKANILKINHRIFLKKGYLAKWDRDGRDMKSKREYLQRVRRHMLRKNGFRAWILSTRATAQERHQYNRTVQKLDFLRLKNCFRSIRSNWVAAKREKAVLKICDDHYTKSVTNRYSNALFRRFKALRLEDSVQRGMERASKRTALRNIQQRKQVVLRLQGIEQGMIKLQGDRKQRMKGLVLYLWKVGARQMKCKRQKMEFFTKKRNKTLKSRLFEALVQDCNRNLITSIQQSKKSLYLNETSKNQDQQALIKLRVDYQKESIHSQDLEKQIADITKAICLLQMEEKVKEESKMNYEDQISVIEGQISDLDSQFSKEREVLDKEQYDINSNLRVLTHEVQEIEEEVSIYQQQISDLGQSYMETDAECQILRTQKDLIKNNQEVKKGKLKFELKNSKKITQKNEEIYQVLENTLEKKREQYLLLQKVHSKNTIDDNTNERISDNRLGVMKRRDEEVSYKQEKLRQESQRYDLQSQRMDDSRRGGKGGAMGWMSKPSKDFSHFLSSQVDKSGSQLSEERSFMASENSKRGQHGQQSFREDFNSNRSYDTFRSFDKSSGVSRNPRKNDIEERMRRLQLCMDHDLNDLRDKNNLE